MTVAPLALDYRPERRARVAVLISGRGSNMIALAEACAAPDYPAEIGIVISNEATAAGVRLAAERGLATATVAHRAYPGDRAGFEDALAAAIAAAEIDVVCLAGFMRVLSADFVARGAGRILNIHPSLLPAFPGLDTHARALAAGARVHGATAHLVDAEVDAGPILAQAALATRPDDTPERLAARVLALEHALYPKALADYVSGRDTRAEGGPIL